MKMEEEHRNLDSPEPNAMPGKRKLALEFDLNETPSPLPSPKAANDVSSSSGELVVRCGSCGKVGPGGGHDVVVCCGCGTGYHVKCLGAKERQVEWKCFKCLLKVGTGDGSRSAAAAADGGGGGGLGLLDINAPPPQEEVDDEGEGFLIGKRRLHGETCPLP